MSSSNCSPKSALPSRLQKVYRLSLSLNSTASSLLLHPATAASAAPSDDMLSLMAMASLPPCPRVLRREWPHPSPPLGRHFLRHFAEPPSPPFPLRPRSVGVDALESYHCRRKPWPEYKGVRERNPAVRRPPQDLGRQGGSWANICSVQLSSVWLVGEERI